MGAGKTSVGMAVAQRLNVPFVDSDDEIVKAADRTIPEIFSNEGEAFFRARETEVLARILNGEPCILSTGGGTYICERNRALISQKGVALWLNADFNTLWRRVRGKSSRPLLQVPDPKAALRTLYTPRVPLYELAELTVKSNAKMGVGAMAERVLDTLIQTPGVLGEAEVMERK